MIEVIAEHSVDLSILPTKANILDAGCRCFGFTNHFRELGHNVVAIDIDTFHGDYLKVGISNYNGSANISNHSDPQARHLVSGEGISVVTLNVLEEINGKFDLIKLDIEGEEINLLKDWTHPVSKQLSVEFHAHTGTQTKDELDALLKDLSQYYNITASWESRHGAGFNYWDVLFIEI